MDDTDDTDDTDNTDDTDDNRPICYPSVTAEPNHPAAFLRSSARQKISRNIKQ